MKIIIIIIIIIEVVPVVICTLGVVSKRLDAWLEKLGAVAENSLDRHSWDSKEAVGKLKEKK